MDADFVVDDAAGGDVDTEATSGAKAQEDALSRDSDDQYASSGDSSDEELAAAVRIHAMYV